MRNGAGSIFRDRCRDESVWTLAEGRREDRSRVDETEFWGLGKRTKLERDQGEPGNEWIITQPIDSCRAIAVGDFDFRSTRVLGNRLVISI
ncbi:MAG: hypothetical protein CMJ77_22345 [Planctomycetaceae bacterium]|nr:hypothetical protein [Planctomycetaceae bacterium]